MARLSDLVNVNINRNTIKIQGVHIPVIFSMTSFAYIQEAYGKEYHIFEKELHDMLKTGSVVVGTKETKLMYTLIYGMMRSAGTECTPQEVESSIPLSDLQHVFQSALDIFNNQNFQGSDMEKLKKDEKK
ncbi:hypothetical protein COI73_29795 [Bacillus cereus]|uniref:hypothetical protein n=1 Tax=Bacillus cereus group TaxID=86661 RepID=UPI000BF2BB99|nr:MULTISPECIES: hypothetical protein [Bacillus cereus group]MED0902501.1 hypothetical protein [Bacillus nitratireducens]MED1509017.1 hypothetical protein [Bacillus proteolyticus]PFI41730.1 hypothetical protein COI73_29795 [Bacillus cereus]PFS09612.1 hypothetical protein COK55_27030 [Bacillus cereus]